MLPRMLPARKKVLLGPTTIVEGIELTANAGEVGQSEVQLEQFWIFSKAVPPRKSARSAAFSPRIEIAVNATPEQSPLPP